MLQVNHRFAYSDEKDTQSGERIEDLERQLKSQGYELKNAREANEDSQLRIEELE